MTIKYTADPAAGGEGTTQTTPDWRASIPEELRMEPSLKDIADVGTLAKSFVHAQKLVGADKIVKPNDKWTESDWSNFWKVAGRPDAPEKYTFKPEGLPESIKIDDAKFGEAKKALHAAGLSDKQASSVLKYYLDTLSKDTEGYKALQIKNQGEAMAALQTEYGDQTKVKINVAQSVVRKFGGDTMVALLEQTGLGNNVEFVKMFAKIGELMLDDKAMGGGNNLILTDANSAIKEIQKLTTDMEFQKSIGNRQDPNHKVNLEKWETLFKVAYPSK